MEKGKIIRCKNDGSILRRTGVVVDRLKGLVSVSFVYVKSVCKKDRTLTLAAAAWARTQNFGNFETVQ